MKRESEIHEWMYIESNRKLTKFRISLSSFLTFEVVGVVRPFLKSKECQLFLEIQLLFRNTDFIISLSEGFIKFCLQVKTVHRK